MYLLVVCHILNRCHPSIYQGGGERKLLCLRRWSQGREMEIKVFYANFGHISSSHQGAAEVQDELP